MEKLIVIYQRVDAVPPPTAAEAIAALADICECCHGVSFHLRDETLDSDVLAAGGDPALYLTLSLWVDRMETLADIGAPLRRLAPAYTAYSVVESAPVDYRRLEWPLGTASPGVTLFAVLRRRPGLSREVFFQRWLRHSVRSRSIHPLVRYHRNAVLRRVHGDGEVWDGIVEERVGTDEDMQRARFYRGPGAADAALASLLGFADVEAGGFRCALMREYLLKVPAWL